MRLIKIPLILILTMAPDLLWVRDQTVQSVASSDGAAFSWIFSGTNREKNSRFSIKGATLIRFKDGKILFQGDYYDPSGL